MFKGSLAWQLAGQLRFRPMASLIVVLILAAAPAAETSGVPPATATVPRTFAVYMQPLGIIGGAALGSAHQLAYSVYRYAQAFYLPLGFSWAAGPGWGIAGSVAVTRIVGFIDKSGWNLSVSLGPTWRPSARRELTGFFVHPKFTFQMGEPLLITVLIDRSGGGAPLDFGPTVSRTFLVGLDVGYEHVFFSRLYVAAQLGASVGYGFNVPGSLASPFAVWNSDTKLLEQSYAWGLNVDFLRVGYAF